MVATCFSLANEVFVCYITWHNHKLLFNQKSGTEHTVLELVNGGMHVYNLSRSIKRMVVAKFEIWSKYCVQLA